MAKRKPTVYNKILKQLTKVNKKLPQEQKVSYSQRREIIKTTLLPLYKGTPLYKIKLKPLTALIKKEYDKIPPKEICDLNYIDPSEYAYIEWFSLDETIRELIPDCVYVKVTAGDYGETKIFNTRNYEYGRKGVQNIVEAIRPDANNNSGKFIFSGYQKLRPRKKNNGVPENYYLDLVLFIIDKKGNQTPMGSTETTRYDLPKDRETRKKKTKIRNLIEAKIKTLKVKRDSRKRAKKTLQKNITKFTATVKRVSKYKNPSKETRAKASEQFNHTVELLEKYYREGKLTKAQYEAALEKIFKDFNS